jgi:hypothetical protein
MLARMEAKTDTTLKEIKELTARMKAKIEPIKKGWMPRQMPI